MSFTNDEKSLNQRLENEETKTCDEESLTPMVEEPTQNKTTIQEGKVNRQVRILQPNLFPSETYIGRKEKF
jgi:hypothetical protein